MAERLSSGWTGLPHGWIEYIEGLETKVEETRLVLEDALIDLDQGRPDMARLKLKLRATLNQEG